MVPQGAVNRAVRCRAASDPWLLASSALSSNNKPQDVADAIHPKHINSYFCILAVVNKN